MEVHHPHLSFGTFSLRATVAKFVMDFLRFKIKNGHRLTADWRYSAEYRVLKSFKKLNENIILMVRYVGMKFQIRHLLGGWGRSHKNRSLCNSFACQRTIIISNYVFFRCIGVRHVTKKKIV